MKYAMRKMWSDVIPYEVIRKVSDKTLEVRQIIVRPAPDHTVNAQHWIFESCPEGKCFRIRLGKKKGWTAGGQRYELADQPYFYHDYSF